MSDPASGIPANRMVSFTEAFPLYLKNYAKFTGRSSRGAYWWLTLVFILISFGIAIIDMFVFSSVTASLGGNGPISIIFSLATFIPSLAIGIRRLHDVGRSGWWTLLIFTIVGILVLLYWYVQPGQRKENAFGGDSEAGR